MEWIQIQFELLTLSTGISWSSNLSNRLTSRMEWITILWCLAMNNPGERYLKTAANNMPDLWWRSVYNQVWSRHTRDWYYEQHPDRRGTMTRSHRVWQPGAISPLSRQGCAGNQLYAGFQHQAWTRQTTDPDNTSHGTHRRVTMTSNQPRPQRK